LTGLCVAQVSTRDWPKLILTPMLDHILRYPMLRCNLYRTPATIHMSNQSPVLTFWCHSETHTLYRFFGLGSSFARELCTSKSIEGGGQGCTWSCTPGTNSSCSTGRKLWAYVFWLAAASGLWHAGNAGSGLVEHSWLDPGLVDGVRMTRISDRMFTLDHCQTETKNSRYHKTYAMCSLCESTWAWYQLYH